MIKVLVMRYYQEIRNTLLSTRGKMILAINW